MDRPLRLGSLAFCAVAALLVVQAVERALHGAWLAAAAWAATAAGAGVMAWLMARLARRVP